MIPRVTVLMTVYNGEAFLRECIDSVLSQTCKDFEFLIIDDCSRDSSIDIIKSYKDKRIRVMENRKNLSQVKSLNIGLDQAQGMYIARIDQDDAMLKYRLEKQLNFLDKNPDVAVVGSWGKVIDANGNVFIESRLPVSYAEIMGTVLFGGYFLMHPSVIFRKDLVMDAGKYNEAVSFTEDYDLWTRLLLKRYKLVNMPLCLVRFRYHKESSSRQFREIQVKNLNLSISNFIKVITDGECNRDLDSLTNFLINVGLMNGAFWSDEIDTTELKKITSLLEMVLRKTISYFNFKNKEIHVMKKVFCKRMLNFAYEACGRGKKSLVLYSFCLRNYPHLYTKPKLYLYPIKSFL